MNKLSLYAGTSNLSSANHPKKPAWYPKTSSQEVKESYQKIIFDKCMGTQNDLHTILD